MKIYKQITLYLILIFGILASALADLPRNNNMKYNPNKILTDSLNNDSRIKIYQYNQNKIFLLVVNYGFQSSIEFAKGEEIETLSLGDSYAWKITPVGKTLFIKPFEENIRTNMTIITNKRTYYFDVVSKSVDDIIDKDLAYVVRFTYPNNQNHDTNEIN